MNVEDRELRSAPQLAVLATIDHALVVTVAALRAAHPEIDEHDECAHLSLCIAADVIRRIQALQLALDHYHAAIADELRTVDHIDDDIPF